MKNVFNPKERPNIQIHNLTSEFQWKRKRKKNEKKCVNINMNIVRALIIYRYSFRCALCSLFIAVSPATATTKNIKKNNLKNNKNLPLNIAY